MWADQCTFGHDDERKKLDGTYVGQNAYLKGGSNRKDKATVNYNRFKLSFRTLTLQLMSEVGDEATLAWYNEVVSPGFSNTDVNPFV